MSAKSMATALILIAALSVSACNTVRGVGRDVQSVGQAVEKTSN